MYFYFIIYNIQVLSGRVFMSINYNIITDYRDEIIVYNHVKVSNPLEYVLPVHTHDVCELVFQKNGNISGIINAETYALTKNCIMIFRAHVPHRILVNDNTEYERYNIIFDENLLANKIFHTLPKDLNIVNFNGNNHIIDLFKKLDYYCENFSTENLKILMTNLVEELLLNLSIAPNSDINRNLIDTHPVISKAIEYISSHYTENITVDDISNHLSITKSHLHHLFKEKLQLSPKKLINIKRLSKAQHLIRMGQSPFSIYMQCGFNDYATFFRNYTSYFGYTPSQENEVIHERNFES